MEVFVLCFRFFHSFNLQSATAGKSLQSEQEAFGHIGPAVREQTEMKVGFLSGKAETSVWGIAGHF